MSKRRSSFDVVRKFGLALPGAEERTMYGAPALKVKGRMFACAASHRSAEPDTLVVLVGFDAREQLLAEDPETYYLTDHYVGYPSLLVRLGRVRQDALKDLLLMAWRYVSAQSKRTGRRPRPRR